MIAKVDKFIMVTPLESHNSIVLIDLLFLLHLYLQRLTS